MSAIAKSFERTRQPGDRQRRPRRADAVALVEVPVRGPSGDDTHPCGDERAQHSASVGRWVAAQTRGHADETDGGHAARR